MPVKQEKIASLEKKQLEPDFWDNQTTAQAVMRELNSLKQLVDMSKDIKKQSDNLQDVLDMLKEEYDIEMHEILEEDFQAFERQLEEYEIKVLLSHEYDQLNCILEVHPGAGGTEACDWANMLYRMYTRYAEKHRFKCKVLDYLPGEEAGIKSVTVLIEGEMAYGLLKSERGVHRLVRISPFDSGARRHTSFASIDVMPEFNDTIEIIIDEKDIKVETMRATGAGGQHVNKTDSAVRITHLPTGISVKCKDERSQLSNKESAMMLLKSKLYQLKIEEQEKKLASIKGDQKLIEWGSQIRSYVFHPYTLVKDARTGFETSNGQAVMDGDIDGFIFAYLKSKVK